MRIVDNKLMFMVKSKAMKLLSTTPVSKGIVTKSIIVAAAVVMAVSSSLSIYSSANADRWDDQMSALRSQMSQYQAQASALAAKAATYQEALNQLTKQKNDIIAQINISQKQYDVLQGQIEETNKKIAENKDALGQILAYMSVDNDISPLEMLASSNNIGDYVDQQNYRSSIQNNLSSTIEQINALKTKLQKSQDEVKVVIEQQSGQKAQLAAKEAEQQILVTKTRGDEAAYKNLANSMRSQVESAAAQQRAYYASLQAQSGSSGVNHGTVGSFMYDNWSGNQGCGGDGYPYCGAQDTYGDPWALLNRECVSYAAWRIDRSYNKTVVPFNWNGTPHGYAYEWLDYAKGAWRVSDPQPGDAVVLPPMYGFAPVGHLMVVERPTASTPAGWVHVSQYNFYGTGEYSTMDIAKSGVVFLRFPN